jgi:uncharacterized protein (TIGR02246 family)
VKGLAAAGEATSQLVESYFAAEMRRDSRRVLEHYCDDAVLVLPDGRSLVGREAIGTFYAQVYSQVTKLDVRVVSMLKADGLTAVEWEAFVVDESGGMQALRGVNVFRTSGGRFADVHTYFGPVA